jgi:hypothetical protein
MESATARRRCRHARRIGHRPIADRHRPGCRPHARTAPCATCALRPWLPPPPGSGQAQPVQLNRPRRQNLSTSATTDARPGEQVRSGPTGAIVPRGHELRPHQLRPAGVRSA